MECSVRRGAVIFGLVLLITVTETRGRPSGPHQNTTKKGEINKRRQDRNRTSLNCTPLIKPVSNYTNELIRSLKNPISYSKSKLEKKYEEEVPKLRCSSERRCVLTMSKRLTYLHHCLQHLNTSGEGNRKMRRGLSRVIQSLQDLKKNLPKTDGPSCNFNVSNADEAHEYAQFFSEKLLDNLKKFRCQEEKQDRGEIRKEKKKDKGGKKSKEGSRRKGRRQKKPQNSSVSTV